MGVLDDPDFGDWVKGRSGKGSPSSPPISLWIRVYAANLPVPTFFGFVATCESGRTGMIAGILAILAIGCRACVRHTELMHRVAYGGWLVAFLQIIPFWQILAGSIAIIAAEATGLAQNRELAQIDTLLGGFLATMATGGLLIALAGLIGLSRRMATGE
jgi:hypothetical protein